MKVTKGEARYNKCKKRKNKYKVHAKVVKQNSQEEQTLFRIFLISLESDFRVSVIPELADRVSVCLSNNSYVIDFHCSINRSAKLNTDFSGF